MCEFDTICTNRVHRGVLVGGDSQFFFRYISFAKNHCQSSVVWYSTVVCCQKQINIKKNTGKPKLFHKSAGSVTVIVSSCDCYMIAFAAFHADNLMSILYRTVRVVEGRAYATSV